MLFLTTNVYYYRQPGFRVFGKLVRLVSQTWDSQEYAVFLLGAMLGGAKFNGDSLLLVHFLG